MNTVDKIAEHFVAILQQWLTDDEMRMVRERNAAETSADICHSHDFCDANMAMDEAFRAVVGHDVNGDSEADCVVWNRAWEIAAESSLGKLKGLRPMSHEEVTDFVFQRKDLIR